MHKSIATIDAPEFINLETLDINPLMSKCEIKVLYLGKNRNGSFIDKDTAYEMAKTLRGAPIVGYYKKDKEDFADHGNRVILDDEGVKFECLTKPYGFVAPDAKVWFQNFDDTDEFGNVETRTYLMTTGYLWTGQYEECKLAVEEGRPQSMELDEKTLKGHWATDKNDGMDFFIINDAVFSKLCILGDDVEPCFEGANVDTPNVSTSFSKIDDNFKKTLFSMMQELQFALQGGQTMENEENVLEQEENIETVEEVVEETPEVTEEVAEVVDETPEAEDATPAVEDPTTETVEEVSEENINQDDVAFAKKDDEEEDQKSEEEKEEASKDDDKNADEQKEDAEDGQEDKENSDAPKTDDKDDEEDEKKKYTLLETNFNELQEKYSALEIEYQKLLAFKAEIENAQKDEMIAQFYFLSDEDKKDVIENKSKYTLEEIESKLSVISVRNKVNFNLDNSSKNDINTEEPDVTTYNLNDNEGSSIPAWVKALQNNQNKK